MLCPAKRTRSATVSLLPPPLLRDDQPEGSSDDSVRDGDGGGAPVGAAGVVLLTPMTPAPAAPAAGPTAVLGVKPPSLGGSTRGVSRSGGRVTALDSRMDGTTPPSRTAGGAAAAAISAAVAPAAAMALPAAVCARAVCPRETPGSADVAVVVVVVVAVLVAAAAVVVVVVAAAAAAVAAAAEAAASLQSQAGGSPWAASSAAVRRNSASARVRYATMRWKLNGPGFSSPHAARSCAGPVPGGAAAANAAVSLRGSAPVAVMQWYSPKGWKEGTWGCLRVCVCVFQGEVRLCSPLGSSQTNGGKG